MQHRSSPIPHDPDSMPTTVVSVHLAHQVGMIAGLRGPGTGLSPPASSLRAKERSLDDACPALNNVRDFSARLRRE